MKRVLLVGFATVLMASLAISPSMAGENDQGNKIWGVWFTTLYFGPPASEDTPISQLIITVTKEDTWYLDSDSQTGHHPLLPPGDGTGEHGIVVKTGGHTFIAKGFWFDDGPAPPATFSLGRSICDLTAEDPDTTTGYCNFDYRPCPPGPAGEPVCPDPTEEPFLELDPEHGFPVVMKRFR